MLREEMSGITVMLHSYLTQECRVIQSTSVIKSFAIKKEQEEYMLYIHYLPDLN